MLDAGDQSARLYDIHPFEDYSKASIEDSRAEGAIRVENRGKYSSWQKIEEHSEGQGDVGRRSRVCDAIRTH